MAYNKGVMAWLSEPGRQVEDLAELLKRKDSLVKAPFLSRLNKATVFSNKYEWREHNYTSKIVHYLQSLAAANTVNPKVYEPTRVNVGSVLRQFGITANTYGYALVTAVSGSGLTVTVDYGDDLSHSAGAADLTLPTGVSAVSNGAPSYFEILGNANEFGSAALSAITPNLDSQVNYLQELQKRMLIADSEARGSIKTIGGTWKEQLRDRMTEMRRDMDLAALYGVKTTGASGTPPTTGGIVNFINALNTTLGGTLTWTNFNTVLRTAVEAGADPNNMHIYASPIVLQAINNWGYSQVAIQDMRDGVGIKFTRVITQFGAMPLFWEPQINSGHFLVADMTKVELVSPSGDLLTFEPLGKTGDRKDAMIVSKMGMRFYNEDNHIYGWGVTG